MIAPSSASRAEAGLADELPVDELHRRAYHFGTGEPKLTDVVFFHMAEDTDKLLARADAAIAEAKRLAGLSEEWQQRTSDRLYLMFSRFSQFGPSDRKTYYPQEFQEQTALSALPPLEDETR